MSFNDALKFVATQSAQSIVATLSLAVGFMLFNDYVAPPPDLSGRWKFTINYDETELLRFKNMQATYQALVVQEDLRLSGLGEGMSAVSPTITRENYKPKDRVNINISGYIKNNFFAPDEFVVQYKEVGAVRETATLHEVVMISDSSGCGCFQSTIAGTRGLVHWQKISNGISLSDPVNANQSCPIKTC